jgi:ParB family chromosome partitioning protein
MLQYPVVGPETKPKGKPTGLYLINAGECRRLAQLLRANRKEIKVDEPIPCILDTEHSASEMNLAENAVRTDMHAADQYDAFAKLHGEERKSAEDIAARLEVTPSVVRQRLQLSAILLQRPGRGSLRMNNSNLVFRSAWPTELMKK